MYRALPKDIIGLRTEVHINSELTPWVASDVARNFELGDETLKASRDIMSKALSGTSTDLQRLTDFWSYMNKSQNWSLGELGGGMSFVDY